MKRNDSKFNITVILLCIAFLLAGCGKKTMVRAPVKVRPPAVSNLKCHVRKNFVELEWQIPPWQKGKKAGRRIAGFEIWRATVSPSDRNCAGCPKKFVMIGSVDLTYPPPAHIIGNTILWKDLGVKVGIEYFYRLVTVDNDGNESLISNTAVANVYYTPVAPKIIESVATSEGIKIAWDDPIEMVNGESDMRPRKYLLYRRTGDTGWQLASPAPLDERWYIDRKVEPGKEYDYRVRTEAFQQGTPTFSDFSNIVKVVALELPPPAPPDTVWVLPSKDGVGIYWLQSGVDGHRIKYNVYRRTENGEIIKLTSEPISKTFFLDSNVKVNRVYKYAITSVRMGKKPAEGPYSKWVEIRFVPL